MNKFLTTNVYLRYFQETDSGEEIYETYISISELNESGCPIHPATGDDLENDNFLYKFDGEKLVQLIG